jgi:hypothetical protein
MIVDGKGAVHINFKRAAGQTWQFVKPHIQFGQYGSPKNQPTIPGVFQVTAAQPDEIRVVDTNSQSPKTAGFYVYSLHTDAGVIDPMIVNNGGP